MDFSTLDWRSIAGAVAPLAPKLGTVLGTVIGNAAFPGLGGGIGASVGGIAGRAIAAKLGVEATPEAVGQAIAEQPDAKEKLEQLEEDRGDAILAQAQVEIERLKQETEQFRIQAADVQAARTWSLQLGGISEWQQAALEFVVVVGFFGTLGVVLMFPEKVKETQMVVGMLGMLGAAFTAVIQFRFGSSASSQRKDQMLGSVAMTQAQSQPEAQARLGSVVRQAVTAAVNGKKH